MDAAEGEARLPSCLGSKDNRETGPLFAIEMNGGYSETFRARRDWASLGGWFDWRASARVSLALVIVTSVTISVLVSYQGRVAFSIFGVDFRSSELFRPLVFASVAYLALGLLVPRLRATRETLAILFCLVAYAFHFGSVPSGDVVPGEYTALSMVTGRGTSLDGYPELVARGLPYYVRSTPHGLQSRYPVGPSLLAWPLFLPAPFIDSSRPALLNRIGAVTALLLAVASVLLVLRIARKLDPPFSPYWVALVYGLGSSHWTISASALWQHGPGELWVLGGIERLLDRESPVARRLAAAGAAMALAVFTRPSLVVSALVLFLLAAWIYRRNVWPAAAAAAATSLPLLYFHLDVYGSLLGGYGAQAHELALRSLAVASTNVFWLLSSPSRGVLWFEPVVLFTLGAALLELVRRRTGTATLVAGISGFALLTFLYANHALWWGGHTVGPRFLTDALPFWVLAFCSMGASSHRFRAIALSLAAVGAVVNLTGTTLWAAHWNANPSVDDYPARLEAFDDSQLLFQLLSSMPGGGHLREAVNAENEGALAKALALWRLEQETRPWHRHAAQRVVDLLIKNDRLDEAEDELRRTASLWPDDPYFAHLSLRMPQIKKKLNQSGWRRPSWARASRNPDLAPLVYDESLGTSWSTVWLQSTKDWLELGCDAEVPTRGVALFYAPEFAEGPSGLRVEGVSVEGRRFELARQLDMSAARKGWIAIRFPAVRVEALQLSILRSSPRRFSVSEARILTADFPARRPER